MKHELYFVLTCYCVGVLRNEDLVPKFEENFEEAVKNVNNSIITSQVDLNL